MASQGERRLRRLRWAAGAALVLAVAAIIVVYVTVEICDQQLSSTGAVVDVCRHPRVTDPPVLALGVMILACLGAYFSKASAYGIALERAVEDAKRTAEEAAREVRQTHERVRETAADLGEGVRQALRQTPAGTDADPIRQLAARYNECRWTLPGGPARTEKMTALAYEMIAVLRRRPDFDVGAHLRCPDRGMRLAAAACLYANPDPAWAGRLAQAAVAEDKPFNEYWALRALSKVLEGHPGALDDTARTLLRQRRALLNSGTDRTRLIDQLLRDSP
ncbi:hypothetical protein AB0F81_28045 [Actinoplanes sp. NPDC024001]|uniref:hypothetical protein n=1 Tax=Actinoplanes sp. NPDC024001 TaxID=3154598 RepID=UPI0033C99F4B